MASLNKHCIHHTYTKYLIQTFRKFSKFSTNINTISIRQYTQIKIDDTTIPDWLPKHDDLQQDLPQYLIEFDENEQESNQNIEIEQNNETQITNINNENDKIIETENTFDSQLILDKLSNNSIYPSPIKYKFTPTLNDIPNEIYKPIENQTAMTADDAANWPIPPWHSPDWIEPKRDENNIIENNITSYPEMFVSNTNNDININLYNNNNNNNIMSYEERVTEENIKQKKLMRQEEVNNYLKKWKEPITIKKLSLIEDDYFRIKIHIIAGIIVVVLYCKYKLIPKMKNKYGYEGKDIERNKRLSKLPIKYRKDGDILHENDLAHLTTVNDQIE